MTERMPEAAVNLHGTRCVQKVVEVSVVVLVGRCEAVRSGAALEGAPHGASDGPTEAGLCLGNGPWSM